MKSNFTGLKDDDKLRSKDTNYTQFDQTYQAFIVPKTMLMVAKETGIERACICWYVRRLRKDRKIRMASYAPCKVSGAIAGYYVSISSTEGERNEGI